MREAFAGVPPEEVRPLVGSTAARVYGFDPGKLEPIAARVGPAVAALG
jgi:hypothetical protein